MDEIGEDGLLRHDVPTGMVFRVILVAGGLFAVIISTLELHRGVWPFNIFSPFFLVILLGACSVGVPMTIAGVFAPTLRWTIGPQRIAIEMINPFGRRQVSITPGAVASFTVREHGWDSRANTWSVVLTTIDGKRYETRDLGTEAAANRLRERIEALFYGPAA